MAFLKKNTADAGKPADAPAATVPAPEKKKAPRRPAVPGEKMTFGDIAVCGATALMVVTIALQLLSLKALFLF